MIREIHPDRTFLPPRGRPRDPELTGRLLTGALDLVADKGLDRFNTDTLALATGAGKAGIYRRWPTSDLLLADALRSCRPVPAVPDTGSLRGDLLALFQPWTRELDRDERAVAAVLGQARHSTDIRAALQDAVVQPLDAAVTAVVDQHQARGHLVPAVQRTVLLRLVQGLWWVRYMAVVAVSTDAEVQAMVDGALMPVVLSD